MDFRKKFEKDLLDNLRAHQLGCQSHIEALLSDKFEKRHSEEELVLPKNWGVATKKFIDLIQLQIETV